MKNLLLKANPGFFRRCAGTTCALFCTAMLTVLAVAVTNPVSVASAQTTAVAKKSPTPKPTPKHTPTPKPTPKRTPTPKRSPTPKHTPTPKPKMCTVCHKGKNKMIPCNDVAKYLKNHPGDTSGPCNITTNTNR